MLTVPCFAKYTVLYRFVCSQSRAGAPNENVLVEDLKLFVQSAVRMVHGVAREGKGRGSDRIAPNTPLRQNDRAGKRVAYTHRYQTVQYKQSKPLHKQIDALVCEYM